MAARERGAVLKYTKAVAEITVYFPNDEVSCLNCPQLYKNDGLDRCRCRLLYGVILPIESIAYGRHFDCPLKIIKEE